MNQSNDLETIRLSEYDKKTEKNSMEDSLLEDF
jgi:hypothetical protein